MMIKWWENATPEWASRLVILREAVLSCPLGMSMLEIGVDRGEVPRFLRTALQARDGKYLGIDVRLPAIKGTCLDKHYLKFEETDSETFWRNLLQLTNNGQTFTCIAEKLRYDLIFIDGSHEPEILVNDFKNALRVLKRTGFVLVHDINGSPIREVWKELRESTHLFSVELPFSEEGMGLVFEQ